MKEFYDVIIVGAGPGGCSAAIGLARRGYEVLLVEKEKFPRGKVCGDGIGPPALDALDRLGILPEVMQRNPWKIDGVKLSSPAGHLVTAPFSHLKSPYPYALVMPRREFDFLIFEQTRKFANVQVLENWTVKDLILRDGSAEGVRAESNGEKREFRGRILVGADGVYSTVRRKIFPRKKGPVIGAFGVRAYFQGVQGLSHHIEVHCPRSILPGYGWVFPMGEDSANVGVGISSAQLPQKDLRKLFQAFIEETPLVKEKLRTARLVEHSFQGAPIPLAGFWRRRSRRNILLVGDAGSFADVLTGEGIYFALRSGECAAEAIHTALSSSGEIEKAGKLYEKAWRGALGSREFLIGPWAQKWIMREFFLNLNIGRAIKKPSMARDLASILCHQKSKIGLFF
jgi:geranylgeranyl reductase family protein